MEIVTGLFIVGLYKATEKIWEKGFDAAWEPVGEALKERFTRWAGRGQESQRQAAFVEAVARARRLTVERARDRETTQAILEALDAGRNQDAADKAQSFYLAKIGSTTCQYSPRARLAWMRQSTV